jgi:hypothetical protein
MRLLFASGASLPQKDHGWIMVKAAALPHGPSTKAFLLEKEPESTVSIKLMAKLHYTLQQRT